MKRLVVCCDGTWQNQNNQVPTNVFKIARAVNPSAKELSGTEISQVLYYDGGIGSISQIAETQSPFRNFADWSEKLGGGAFGWGIDEKIEAAYIFLCLNYEPGDEIYLFGFSRGAYTVRSLAGLISCSGLLKRPDINKTADAYSIYRQREIEKRQQKANEFRRQNNTQSVEINFLGCWDTVGALGIPNFTPLLLIDELFNIKYQFHDNELSPIIKNARHAIAIDEKTPGFDVTIMKPSQDFQGTLRQVWFPGNHGCVGGGVIKTLGLSNATLQWMGQEASDLGLDLAWNLIENNIDYATPFPRNFLDPFNLRERDIAKLNDELSIGFKFERDRSFHHTVKARWCDDSLKYRPRNLQQFLKNETYNWCA